VRPRLIGSDCASTTIRVSSQSQSARAASLGGTGVPSSSVTGGTGALASVGAPRVARR